MSAQQVLYCTVLYCTVLYCIALYCTVLYCHALSAQQDIGSPLDFGLSRHSSIISLNKHHGKESPFHEYRIELQTKVREMFTIAEKAPPLLALSHLTL